jgi:hypothetical protein
MTSLPDPHKTYAVLIGASNYHSADLRALPTVRNNLSGMFSVLTDPERGGLPRDHCTVIVDPGEPRVVSAALRQAGRQAEDTLLIYYAGHGLLGPRIDALFLAMTGTDQDDLRYSALDIDAVREAFLDSSAVNRVLILDCCFSGRAIEQIMGDVEDLLTDKIRINGACVVASAPANWPALAPRDARYTAFTGALLDLLHDGIVNGPEILSVRLVYQRLSQILIARGLPEPQFSATNTVEQLGLVRNGAYEQPQTAEMSAMTSSVTASAQSGVRRHQVRFQQRPWHGWFDRWIWRLATWGPLAAVIASWHALQPPLRLGLVGFYGLLSVLVLLFISDLYPTRYELVFDHSGIELVVGTSRYQYPWHRVQEVQLVPDRRHARRSGHILALKLQPGTLPPKGPFLAPVPRFNQALQGLRFAETVRLANSSDEIERVLGRFASARWRPASDISIAGDTRNYPARRATLAAEAVMLLVLGLSPLLIFCGLFRCSMSAGVLTLAALWAGILSVPGLIVGAWARYPGHLKLDGEGIEVALGGRISRVAWPDMERVRLVGWLPETPGNRFLAIRPWPKSTLPRTRITLPWTYRGAGIAILCPVHAFAVRQSDLHADLDRFAGSAWEAATGLYVPIEDTADRVRFAGRLMGPHAWLSAIAGFVAINLLNSLAGLLHVPTAAREFALPLNITSTVAALGLCGAGVLLARDRFSLTIDSRGLALQAGRTFASIPWDDIDRVAIIRSPSSADGLIQTPWSSRRTPNNRKRKKPHRDREYLVAWLRDGAAPPRKWWTILGVMRPGLGGVAIIQLDNWLARLFATRIELERALVRYAETRLVPERETTEP